MSTIYYNNKLEGFSGNSKEITCFVYDASSSLMDITNYNGYYYMQKYPIREGNPIDVSVLHTNKDASNGAFYFNLSTMDLDLSVGDYVYEIIIDNGTLRYTVVQDKFNLKKSIV